MSTDRSISLHVPRLALWILGFLLLAPWLIFGAWLLLAPRTGLPPASSPTAAPAVVSAPPAPSPTAPSDLLRSKPGPWGELVYFRSLIEPPEEFILTDYTGVDPLPWVFKGYTPEKLAALWTAAGLTAAQRELLDDPARRQADTEAIVVRPRSDTIIGLTPAARAVIYSALADFTENFAQFNPYRLRHDFAAEWFDGADLPASAIALTKQMLYTRGATTCFSDYQIVLSTLTSPAERSRYVKTLSRKSALVVQLVVRPGADIQSVDRYWSRGRRSKDITPLLQSLARRPNGGSIDIIHLLPPFARAHLYTYPLPSERPADATHDCHWSSFNFFKDTPDRRFDSIDYTREVLLNDYYPVFGEPVLGDILMLMRKDGTVVHSCVYVADDIVFTKNGPAFSVPWLLSPLDSVVAFYGSGHPLEIRRYRAK